MIATIFLWIILSIAVGMFARIRRNRSGFGWFCFSCLLFSPLIGIIFVAILKEKQPKQTATPLPAPQPPRAAVVEFPSSSPYQWKGLER